MNEKIQLLQHKIDGLNQRERIVVMLAVLVLVVMLLQTLLLDPLLKKRGLIARQSVETAELAALQDNELQVVKAQLAAGVNRHEIRQRDQLQLLLTELNNKIESSVVAMIPPRIMPQVLENILSQNKNLKLLSVENRPVVAIVDSQTMTGQGADDPSGQSVDAGQQVLYRHSFVLKLQGSYSAAIDYFNSLGELPWRFYWDDLRYQVEEYPRAVITLEVHTVSMSEEWLGV